jgi:hypothetical protein
MSEGFADDGKSISGETESNDGACKFGISGISGTSGNSGISGKDGMQELIVNVSPIIPNASNVYFMVDAIGDL